MASLDTPAPFFSQPGPDQQPIDVDTAADALIAVITADRNLDDRERRALQRVYAATAQMAMQAQAAAQGGMGDPMSNETEDFGAGEGVEEVGDFGAAQGAQYMQG